jgi:hypothetical protein
LRKAKSPRPKVCVDDPSRESGDEQESDNDEKCPPFANMCHCWGFCEYAGDESLPEVKVLSSLMVADFQLISKAGGISKFGG